MGDVGHKGGLINPRPGRGKCRAGSSNTGGSPMPRKRAPNNNNKKKCPPPQSPESVSVTNLTCPEIYSRDVQEIGSQHKTHIPYVHAYCMTRAT